MLAAVWMTCRRRIAAMDRHVPRFNLRLDSSRMSERLKRSGWAKMDKGRDFKKIRAAAKVMPWWFWSQEVPLRAFPGSVNLKYGLCGAEICLACLRAQRQFTDSYRPLGSRLY
jgi:hypothetical protein